MLRAMAGYDAADATTSVLPVPDYAAALDGDVKGLRIGMLRDFVDSAAPEVKAAVERAVGTLTRAGAVVDDVSLPVMRHAGAAAFAIVASEALAYHAEHLRTRAGDYQADVRERLMIGIAVSGLHYVRAQQVRALARAEVDQALARRDVLLAPSTPIAATVIGERHTMIGDTSADVRASLLLYTRAFNLSGHPACSLPCGFTRAGLPIGLQLVGRPFDEATVLRVADAFQRVTDFHTRRPVLA
jgi:aspartyl-tRNA(Asn)/glutamyl-tRNA(Gln) amidotransferase subunit A